MGRAVFKFGEDQYLEWSSVVDAPVTLLMPKAEAVRLWGEARVKRADKRGHSYQDAYMNERETPEELISCNRAGPNEETLTLPAFLRRYKDRESYENFEFQPGDRIEFGYVGEDGFWVELDEPRIV